MTSFDADLLDDADGLTGRDEGNLLWELARAGAQVRHGVTGASEAGLERLRAAGSVRSLIVAGDAATADSLPLLTSLAGHRAPSLIWDEADPPSWAGPSDALLVGCLEGLNARLTQLVDAARRRGLAIVVVAPAGSAVADAAGREPVVPLDPGLHPAAARWSVLVPLITAAVELGLAPAPTWSHLAEHLDQAAQAFSPYVDSYGNPAKSLALQLAESYPIVVGAGQLAAVATHTIAHVFQAVAGLPALGATLPGATERVIAVLRAAAREDSDDDFFRDRTEETAARPRLVIVGAEPDPFAPESGMARAESGADRDRDDAGWLALRRLQGLSEQGSARAWPVEVPEAPPLNRFAVALAFADFVATYVALATGRSTRDLLGPPR